VIGAVAGVAGTIVSTLVSNRREMRRIAIDSGFREWERLHTQALDRGGSLFPPAAFVFFNLEVLKLIERDEFTPDAYRKLFERAEAMNDVIRETSQKRQAKSARNA
jgi:hypothetical protein